MTRPNDVAAGTKHRAWLVPVAGPALPPLEIEGKAAGAVVGRSDGCDLMLPADADGVSRFHCRLSHARGIWTLADLKSRWGTFLNGMRLPDGDERRLADGDLIRISPWTFTFSTTPPRRKGMLAVDDTAGGATLVRGVAVPGNRGLADDLTALLLEGAAALHDAPDQRTLAEALIDIAARGTGLPNASFVVPVDTEGRIDVVATKVPADGASDPAPTAYSRSLIAAASAGEVVELADGAQDAPAAASILRLGIRSALCVPLTLGQTVAAYLYLDARAAGRGTLRPGASAFAVALGRIASLALANLKRVEMERRQALLDADLAAAAEAQRWILPPRAGRVGPLRYTGLSRPGQTLGGDFFDVIPLAGGRLAVTLGDVTGKGVEASVLMTAAQGFLHAALTHGHPDPARAVTALNRFVSPRRPASRFVTLWVGVFDPAAGTLTYVDAGHGYAVMVDPTGALIPLDSNAGVPAGVVDDFEYQSATVPLSSRGVLVVSDGIIEQFGGFPRAQFEMDGVRRALAAAPAEQDLIDALFAEVIRHAATEHLADDATAVWVR